MKDLWSGFSQLDAEAKLLAKELCLWGFRSMPRDPDLVQLVLSDGKIGMLLMQDLDHNTGWWTEVWEWGTNADILFESDICRTRAEAMEDFVKWWRDWNPSKN